MGTRSTIALEFADGSVEQVYCHWDGYLEGNGQILKDHYNNPFILHDLIKLGDLSSLRKQIGVKHPFDAPGSYSSPEYQEHKAKYSDMCTFYGRDRGETGIEARRFMNFDEYLTEGQYEEYNYILRMVNDEPVWFVQSNYMAKGQFIPLDKAFELEMEQE